MTKRAWLGLLLLGKCAGVLMLALQPATADAEPKPKAPGYDLFAEDDSACRVKSEELPDGTWYGKLAEATSGYVTFDVMCIWRGVPGQNAARADGHSLEGVEYYVRNRTTKLRKVAVDAKAYALWWKDPKKSVVHTIPYADWLRRRSPPRPDVYITVSGGRLASLQEHYGKILYGP